jgi:hypothetical protein
MPKCALRAAGTTIGGVIRVVVMASIPRASVRELALKWE